MHLNFLSLQGQQNVKQINVDLMETFYSSISTRFMGFILYDINRDDSHETEFMRGCNVLTIKFHARWEEVSEPTSFRVISASLLLSYD